MLKALTIFVFSVMCHANAVPVVNMLERPSVERIVKVATYSNSCCWALYLFIGVGGYLSFQASVQGDFLLNYPVGSVSILCCRMLLAVVCYVGIPMNSSSCTLALQKLLAAAVQRTPEPQMEERPLLFASLATFILAIAALGAIHLKDVAQVISVVGGSLTTLQMFWIPAFIYWKILYPSQPPIFRKCVMTLMILAGSAGFTSVFTTLFA
jgi:amino acid permease